MGQRAFSDDALPPESTYESRESLLAAINSWAKPRGYAFTTGKSSKTPNGRIKVVFACDRRALPPSTPVERKRHTSSRGTGCKFSVLAKQSLDGNTWVLSHRQDKEFALHNHPPSQDASAHPVHRQFEERDIATISSLTVAGVAPREIRTYLNNNSHTLATQQDVYNRIAATRRDLREGQSSIQALVDQLKKEDFWCRVRLDSDNRLTAIFFAHPDSVAYLQGNPDVLLLDCTYKTNKHGMPLLDMVGVDSCQRSFCIAFAFLSGESEEDYSWALEHLKSLYQRVLPSVILTDRCLAVINAAATWFPSCKALLCLWHVNKAVVQHCQPAFDLKRGKSTNSTEEKIWNEFYGSWHSIVASPTEKVFEERLADFEAKYAEKYLEAVGYIKTYWLGPYKERIVKAWVDMLLHFGNVVTSR
jgi:MULE transposase domain